MKGNPRNRIPANGKVIEMASPIRGGVPDSGRGTICQSVFDGYKRTTRHLITNPHTTVKFSMANITPGAYKIVSLLEGNPPTSVNLTLPGFQTVYLNGPVTTVWQLFVSIQNLRLTLSTTVGCQARRQEYLSAQSRWLSLHWSDG